MKRYDQEFHVEDAILHVRLAGEFPHERLALEENLFKPLIDRCRQENCCEAIVDARELQVGFNTAALFRVGVDAAAMNSFGLRVALLARADMIDSFFDDVTHNRGAPVKVFTDLADASSWVRQHRTAVNSTPRTSP